MGDRQDFNGTMAQFSVESSGGFHSGENLNYMNVSFSCCSPVRYSGIISPMKLSNVQNVS